MNTKRRLDRAEKKMQGNCRGTAWGYIIRACTFAGTGEGSEAELQGYLENLPASEQASLKEVAETLTDG